MAKTSNPDKTANKTVAYAQRKGREAKQALEDGAENLATDFENEGIEGLAERSGEMLHDVYTRGEDAIKTTSRELETRTQDNPLLMLGIAFAAGAVLSKLMRR